MPITRRTRPTFLLTNSTEVEVIRPGEVRNEYGIPVESPPSVHTIEANIQPLGWKELQVLPEADRNKEWIEIYAHLDADIREAKEGGGGWKPDIVVWNGDHFSVIKIQRWQMGVLDHICVRAARIPTSGGKL